MKCLQVTFMELYEADGAFGEESISPGGGVFPKHLVLSYDLKAKIVVFPIGWAFTEAGGTNEDNWTRTICKFRFGEYYTIFRRDIVKKVDFVEVDYDPDEFKPNENLATLTLCVVRHKKDQADALIKRYQSANLIVAVRSRESSSTRKINNKNRRHNQYLYELIVKKSSWKDFTNELFRERLVIENKRFNVLVNEAGVFPRQLANFNK